MRLLSTSSWKLEDFADNDIPKYAILSHRWEKDEISFQDLQLGPMASETKKGWSKLKGCRAQAVRDDLQWIWVDTCCIDKSSSAELTEAINSMFNWYKEAQVCYAYLSDVSPGADISMLEEENSSFRSSKWFTRGWTLQELLAPETLMFFDSAWGNLGEKNDMWYLIGDITGITKDWKDASVAQKFSWAARRETTRAEDKAYSLLGLFGVNMPPLYGERDRAFLRLQLEILKVSDDESIFAWQDPKDLTGGLLGRSLDAFRESGRVRRRDFQDIPSYWMTNKGLRMERVIEPVLTTGSIVDGDDMFLLILQCEADEVGLGVYAILVKCIKSDQFARILSGELIKLPALNLEALLTRADLEKAGKIIYVKQGEGESETENNKVPFSRHGYLFSLYTASLSAKGFAVTKRFKHDFWSSWHGRDEDVTQWVSITHQRQDTVALEFTKKGSSPLERIVVIFNVYVTRCRMAAYVPNNDLSMDRIMSDLLDPGDWMTNKTELLMSQKLSNGQEINCALVRDIRDTDNQRYQAKISFEEIVSQPATSS